MTNHELAGRIRAALEHDTAVNLHTHPITVAVGREVMLSGTVADIIAKRRAAQLARALSGTLSVRDELYVSVARARADAELAEAVIHHLRGERAFLDICIGGAPSASSPAIGVTVGASVATLAGSVPSIAHRRLAEVITWWTPGVADVSNRLRARPAEDDNDDELTDVIRQVMEMDSALDAGCLGIRVRDRIVSLTGAIHDEVHGRLAVRNCYYVPGVHGVTNNLRVVPPSRRVE